MVFFFDYRTYKINNFLHQLQYLRQYYFKISAYIRILKKNAFPQSAKKIHAMTPTHKNVDAYIKSFDGRTQKILEQVRQAIQAAVPEAAESISYAVFCLKKNPRPKPLKAVPVPYGRITDAIQRRIGPAGRRPQPQIELHVAPAETPLEHPR